MSNLFGRILKWIAYLGAAGVMLLALLVGIARLFLPLVPDYQEDIRQWTAQATGYDVEFQNITATWPLAGPELKFIDVIVADRQTGDPIFVASSLSAGISLLELISERKFLLNRLGVEGSSLDVRRSSEGEYFIQGLSLDEFLPAASAGQEPLRLPDLLIGLSDIELNFTDESNAGRRNRFGIEQLEVRLSNKQIDVGGEIGLDPEFGDVVSVSVDIPTALFQREPAAAGNVNRRGVKEDPVEWSIGLIGAEVDLVNISEYILKRPVPVSGARGGLAVNVSFTDLDVSAVNADLDLGEVGFDYGAAGQSNLEALRGIVDWRRDGAGGWSLTASDYSVVRRDLFTTLSDIRVSWSSAAPDEGFDLAVRSEFLRLQDLFPLVRLAEYEQLLPADLLGETALPTGLRGELGTLSLDLARRPEADDEFGAAFEFSDLGTTTIAGAIAFSGLSGTLKADQGGGSLQIDARDARADLPALFRAPIDVEALDGLFVWRVTADRVRVLSDDVRVRHSSVAGNSRLELIWPLNDESPRIDLTATAVASDARGVLPLLPLRKFPPQVGAWLDNAILAGRVTNAEFEVSGPLRQFPFAEGEGVFRVAIDVENGVLNYADQWPRITDLDANLVFDGPGLYSLRNSGRLGRLEFSDSTVRIEKLGKGLLEVVAREQAPLEDVVNFVQRSPVAGAIGPLIDDVTADGRLEATVSLQLPVLRANEFQLGIEAVTENASLGLANLDWGLTDIRGSLSLNNTLFRATGMTATLLDEPVTIDLIPAGRTSQRFDQFIRINGRTPLERWMQTLSLPFVEQIDGPADWQALVMIPRAQAESRPPVHILARSALEGVESRLPVPLTKTAADRRPLEIDIAFPASGRLEVSGRLLPALAWIFALDANDAGWRIERGGVHAGPSPALLPVDPGVELSGRLDELSFDDWLALTDTAGDEDSDWQRTWRSAELDIGRLVLFDQTFDAVRVEASQSADAWQVRFDAESIAGDVGVPFDLDTGGPVTLDMARLRLSGSTDEGYDRDAQADPRLLPAIEARVEEFEINDMRFGSLETTITPVVGGVEASPIRTRAPAFSIDGDAAWLVNPNDDSLRQTRLSLSLQGNGIKNVLTSLGYDPVIDGEQVSASGELTWLGGPSGDFLWRADGSFSIRMEDGALRDLEPGGGRILGVLSLATLPRRLSFNFSDLIDEGLAFDTLGGDFTLDDGNAYTCNLSMEGPVTDMGIVGRVGFESRDYDQIAVIRPHVSTLFAAGGFVVGGPVAGAAMLLFSQIFQKPLSTLGESYHSVTGTWDEPVVEQLRGNDIDSTPLRNCESFLSEAITESLKE